MRSALKKERLPGQAGVLPDGIVFLWEPPQLLPVSGLPGSGQPASSAVILVWLGASPRDGRWNHRIPLVARGPKGPDRPLAVQPGGVPRMGIWGRAEAALQFLQRNQGVLPSVPAGSRFPAERGSEAERGGDERIGQSPDRESPVPRRTRRSGRDLGARVRSRHSTGRPGSRSTKRKRTILERIVLFSAADGTRTRTPIGHKHLKLASLPIPAQPHVRCPDSFCILASAPDFVKRFFGGFRIL